MDVSIIIVNWNTRELLSACLDSVIAGQEFAVKGDGDSRPDGSLAAEIFVVDNASTDGSPAMVRERFPQVRLIENAENIGFARANNQAIRQSRGHYVLLLNSDTEVYPGALSLMFAFMAKHPQAGGCGPRLLNADGSLQESCQPMLTPGREFWRLIFLERLWQQATYCQAGWDMLTPRPVEVIKGACFLLRRTALQQVGLLDEQYYIYTEEVDLCYRLLQSGWELWWVPPALVKHYGQASSVQMAEAMYVQLYRSKIQFYRKFGGAGRADLFKNLLRLAYLPRLMVAWGAAPFSPAVAARASTYRRLLSELADM